MKYQVKYVLCEVRNDMVYNCKDIKEDSKLSWIESFIIQLMRITDRPVRLRNIEGRILAYDFSRKVYVPLDRLEVDQTFMELFCGLFTRSINNRIKEYKKGLITLTPPITRENIILKYNGKVVSRGCYATLNHMEAKLLKAHLSLQGKKYGIVI